MRLHAWGKKYSTQSYTTFSMSLLLDFLPFSRTHGYSQSLEIVRKYKKCWRNSRQARYPRTVLVYGSEHHTLCLRFLGTRLPTPSRNTDPWRQYRTCERTTHNCSESLTRISELNNTLSNLFSYLSHLFSEIKPYCYYCWQPYCVSWARLTFCTSHVAHSVTVAP